MVRLDLWFVGVAGLVAIAAPAQAAVTFGSAGFLNNRECVGPSSDPCVGGPRLFYQTSGGVNASFDISAANINGLGASADASVEFGPAYLPTLRIASQSGATTRTAAFATGFQAFTYTGARSINLALSGDLHFFTSGNIAPGDLPGEGFLRVSFAVIPIASLAALNDGSTAEDILGTGLSGDCAYGEIAEVSTVASLGKTRGEYTTNIALSRACDGGAIKLNSGDSFAVVATMGAVSNRLGFVDATRTFTLGYDPVATVFADTGVSVGASYLTSTISAVPELSTWASLVLGFGLSGAAMRRRRAVSGALPAS